MTPQTVLSLWHGPIVVAGTMKSILEDVATERDLSVSEIMSERRYRYLVRARQEAMWRMVRAGKWSFPQIGRFFRRDHATVIWGVRAHEKRLAIKIAA